MLGCFFLFTDPLLELEMLCKVYEELDIGELNTVLSVFKQIIYTHQPNVQSIYDLTGILLHIWSGLITMKPVGRGTTSMVLAKWF